MIPKRLSIRNFMCYRDGMPSLHFDGIHTACISGDNGNGKSALIDAITWALWGKTRAKSDDDLVYQGQTEMEIEFDFSVGGESYRIIRKHSKPKLKGRSPQTSLELQIDSGENSFRPITGNTKAETQEKITGILHMDYETFTSSAFLRQGNADEFTKNQPAKRKEVLANILNLSLYDGLEERARELSREKEAGKAQLEFVLQDIASELAQKPAFKAELQRAQGELLQVEENLKQQELELAELRKKKELLESKRSELAQLEESIQNTRKILEHLEGVTSEHQSRIRVYEELISKRITIEEGYTRFTQTRGLSGEFDRKLKRYSLLSEQKHRLEMRIAEMSQGLSREHTLIESKIGELEAKVQRLPGFEDELQELRQELAKLEKDEENFLQRREASQKLSVRVHQLLSDQKRLESEIGEIEEKLRLLLAQTGARCPLCESELGKDGLKVIEDKYGVEKEKKTNELASIREELAKRKAEFESLEGELSYFEAELNRGKAQARGRESVKRRELAEAQAALVELGGLKEKLASVGEQLLGVTYAPAEKQKLKEVEDELASLGYDSQKHEEVRENLEGLSGYEDLKRRLEEASSLLSQEKEALVKDTEALREQDAVLKACYQKVQVLSQELGPLPRVIQDLAQAENRRQELSQKQRQAQEMVGSAKGRLERCLELEKKKKESERLLGEVSEEAKIYKDLAQAFGKGGVQALIIEAAIPEIEVEANRLLSRMTDGRMHLKIETQRPTKKGDVIETLDINISDELGLRNYELFSGGEAFRINFAIRIALSKLLAKRAGAPLLTLIIDEGFGTQDSTGIEKLKEAISTIKDDFDKIFVITHIEELRDAFPTRINVTKTASGSTLSLS